MANSRAQAVAVDLDGVLGDTGPLWRDWLADAERRARVELDPDPAVLDERLPNWRPLLERFAQEHAPVYLRPRADVSAALRRLQAAGTRIGVFTDAPLELARVAVSQLGAARRTEVVGTLDEVRAALGPGTLVARSPEELARVG